MRASLPCRSVNGRLQGFRWTTVQSANSDLSCRAAFRFGLKPVASGGEPRKGCEPLRGATRRMIADPATDVTRKERRRSTADFRRPLLDEIVDADDIDDPRTEGPRSEVPSGARNRPSPPGRGRPGERGM